MNKGKLIYRLNTCFIGLLLSMLAINQANANCLISNTNTNVGVYNPLADQDLNNTITLTVNCDAPTTVTMSITAGNSQSFAGRYLQDASSGDSLLYNLYADIGHSLVFGDGTNATYQYTGLVQGFSNVPVYLSIPKGQPVTPGSYQDDLQINLNF